jgi:hypothetical protein
MTRLLLALLLCSLCGLALLGAFAQAFRGKRPALLARRDPALA